MQRLRLRRPLLAILAASFAYTVVYVLRIEQYFVQPDELEYVKQAIRIGSHLHPILSGDRYFTSWSQLQPVLMAPAWSLLSANAAFKGQHIINAAIMASAAIPAYLLALRVSASRGAAYAVAGLTVLLPWMAMSATMLTEVAAYPAFLWGVLAVQVAIVRPGVRTEVLALAGIALAVFARPQFAVIAPAFAIAAIVHELRFPAIRDWMVRRARVRGAVRGRPVLVAAIAVGVAALVIGLAGSRSGVLGSYSVATTGSLLPPGTWSMGREALAYVAVGVGVLPLALGLAFALLNVWRPSTPDRHAFAWLSLLIGVGLTAAVGAFSVRFTGGINSRYEFFLAPLMLVGSAGLLAERRRAPLAWLAGAALMFWLIRDAQLALRTASLVSPDAAFHDLLFGRIAQLENDLALRAFPPARVLAGSGVLAVLVLIALRAGRRGRAAAALALAGVTVWCGVETGYCLKKIDDTQAGVSQAFIDGRSWIDGKLPAGASAPVLISSAGDPSSAPAVWWDVGFWNKKVARVLQVPNESNYQQPFPQQVSPADDGRVVGAEFLVGHGEGPGDSPWLIRSAVDRRFGFVGARVTAENAGVQIVHVRAPLTARWQLMGPDDTGLLDAGSRTTLVLFGRPGPRRMTLTLTAPAGAKRAARVVVTARGVHLTRTVPVHGTTTVSFTLRRFRLGKPAAHIAAAGRPAAPGKPPVGVQITGLEAVPA